MVRQKFYNSESEPVGYVEMLKDPIFAKVAGAGRYRPTVQDVIALCEETRPQILDASRSR